jgi:exopolysaccharide biosynthesis protein
MILSFPRHCEAEGRSNLRLYLYNAFLLIIIFLLFSCTTTRPLSQDDILPPAAVEWTELKPGCQITNQKIRELGVSWTCVKIDLAQLEAGPVITVSKKPFSVKDFARKNDLTVAINTTSFSKEGSLVKPQGIVKDNGKVLSELVEQYCALAITTCADGTLTCTILENQSSEQIEKYDYVIGGFFVILQDGQILEYVQNRRSRTACGIDDTGRILYLFAVTPDFSLTDKNGLSYPECAAILQQLGCTSAMQFDGGHSTAMVINGKTVRAPLFQRKVAAAAGF